MEKIIFTVLFLTLCSDGFLAVGSRQPSGDNEVKKREAETEKRNWHRHANRGVPSPSTNRETCYSTIRQCHIALRPYNLNYVEKPEDVINRVHRDGLHDVCTAAQSTYNCLASAYKSYVCRNVSRSTDIESTEKDIEMHNFLCNQLKNEIEANRDCLINYNVIRKFFVCLMEKGHYKDHCNKEIWSACASSATDDSSVCSPDARDVFTQSVDFYMSLYESCNDY